MWKKAKISDSSAAGQGGLEILPPKRQGIKRRSKVPGVMITQYVEELPEGKTTPDFTRKPIALTIQEGKLAIFKAKVIGDPAPTVTWRRAKGEMNDPQKFQIKYDPAIKEHTLEIPKVSGDEADTYKCYASNEYGKAVCTVVLNIIEAVADDPKEFRKKLRRSAGKKEEKKEGDIDEAVWDLLLSSDKKDYERICAEYGITNFRGMLKKLVEMKKEREEEQAEFIQHISNLKPIEVKSEDAATFEMELELKDPNSRIFLYKDGVMIPFSKDADLEMKHCLKQVGKKYVFTVKNLSPDDAGIYQVDIEGVNIFSTDFKIPPVDFALKIKEVKAQEREDALFECVLTQPINEIIWTLKNTPLTNNEKYEITSSEDKLVHRLKIVDCMPVDAGIYAALAGIKSCSAWLIVEDPGVHFSAGLEDCKAIVGEAAELVCKLSKADCEGVWSKDGNEITASTEGMTMTKDGAVHKLNIDKVTEEFAGNYRFEADGRKTECVIVVEDPPRLDSKDVEEFAKPVVIKHNHKATFKMPYIGREPCKVQWYKDGEELTSDTNCKIEISEGESCLLLNKLQRKDNGEIKIKIKNEFGTVEALSYLVVLAYPGQPSVPKVVSAIKDCINLTWTPPANTGGTNILGYNLEKRKKGSSLWGLVNPPEEPIKTKKYAVKDVIEGMEYEFRVSAINISGAGEPSTPSEYVFARDPKKPPGKVKDLKVTDSNYTNLSLSWTKPKEEPGVQDEAKGYFVDVRPAENTEWDRCNTNAIIMTTYTVKGMKSMGMYWVRVIAVNAGGEGEAQELDNYVLAMPPPVRPRFTDAKIKSFMVVRAGNSARFNINFEASPWPDVIWLKDGIPVSKRATISNAEGGSQILIPSAERSDSGIYTIIIKNVVGQETFSIEIRVTDEPKPPGPVELDENVPGTVTVSWEPSPDEKRDDRLHYMVTKRDSSKRTWNTVGDCIFNNRFTVCNIMPGREYHFRVYSKNDIGLSAHSESPKWLITCKKEKITLAMPESKTCSLERPPKFMVPLKIHSAPQGYECYMSCAVRGNPTPYVTWYRDNVSLNTNTNYHITNTCGVCSMLILRVGPKDTGEYKIIAENPLGRAECSTILTVRE
ncbi:immunoglobulin-like and fibronectin type III domain-containing protein 1 [Xyrauchen texanus]|uniref:immunoglobulin-like and fibronectin type III domain-containing protein 1 n=1 Tax=Xyrauchen texanus TaxID=154827 RepID=UPI002241D2C6|nr:immunoglobulin-like and fibronectin type III domain-containing protein 1 [Xyrauchen texanus]